MWLPVWSDISCCCVGKESDDRTEWRRWVAEWWTAICLRGRSGKEVLAVVGVDAARDSLRVWQGGCSGWNCRLLLSCLIRSITQHTTQRLRKNTNRYIIHLNLPFTPTHHTYRVHDRYSLPIHNQLATIALLTRLAGKERTGSHNGKSSLSTRSGRENRCIHLHWLQRLE